MAFGVMLLAALGLGGPGVVEASGPEVNASILVMYAQDLARCPDQVRRAHAILPGSTINFVPHLFFRNDEHDDLVSFCQRFDRYESCEAVTPRYLAAWQRGWERCFQAAVDLDLGLAILPHLDGAEATSQWRNAVSFDPLQPYPSAEAPASRGYSYRETMIEPLVRALERTARHDTRVHFALQGEMGRTLFRFPSAYAGIVAALQSRLSRIADATVGISVNFNKIDGTTELLWFEPDDAGDATKAAMRRLLERIDFLGVSSYHWMHSTPRASDFEAAIGQFVMEWSYRDLPLPEGLPLAFSEFGIGGGWRGNDGARPARSRLEAALHPWSGIYAAYDAELDPWQRPELRAFRREFFDRLLEFLEKQSGPHRVEAAYLWNVGSWDVLGLFPGMEPYADEVTIDRLRSHNLDR